MMVMSSAAEPSGCLYDVKATLALFHVHCSPPAVPIKISLVTKPCPTSNFRPRAKLHPLQTDVDRSTQGLYQIV